MRNYAVDSPEAISRIIALALLADGALDHCELMSLEKHALFEKLRIDPETLDRVIHEFCNDMLQVARPPNVGQIELDRELIDHLLDDIGSPELQQQVLSAVLDIVNADGCLNPGEALLVSLAMSHWGLELQRVTRIEVRKAHPVPLVIPQQFG
ncbi:MAG: hypothetical protein V5B39_19090 [Accumulibacter sp.]|jgi:hypothetical protein|uniref:hypothetical protein n=1 Tax=Accumulibacter sp. TaxID=2053492 RepID=UPI002FC28FEF